ncbi:MAG TPA: tetratricopeptide repeat protein [Gemmatimonadales bacterium]|nr:tetratricopeptide repeat protein [Gemmatimonadales bacterium]
MSDDVRALTAQLAADPASLVFLPLGEALRRRGQLDAAQKVALQGLGRHPHLPDAHDLFARILTDKADFERAFDEWDMALRLDPQHAGAHKGLGFLFFKAGRTAEALEHLEQALAEAPDDPSLQHAAARVRAALGDAAPAPAPVVAAAPAAVPAPDEESGRAAIFAGLEGAESGLLLVDTQGLRLGGGLRAPDGADVADVVAAHLAGVSREAARTAKLLGLGQWEAVVLESPGGNAALLPVSSEALLLVVRDTSVPTGRLQVAAERAGRAARAWLETLT